MTTTQLSAASGADLAERRGAPYGGTEYHEVISAFEEIALLTVSDSVQLNDVLRLVGQRLCELLGVSRCSLYLRRPDGRFQGQVGYCVGRSSIDAGVRRLVSGIDHDLFTAEIVRSQAPVLVQNAAKDPRTIRRTMRQWGVRDMLGVPLVVDGEVTGIIYVDNQGEFHEYTEHDVRVAQAFAGLSALAVRQAHLFRSLGEHAKQVDRQRRVLGDSVVMQDRVARAVLDGADVPQVLELIAQLLGKPVVLYGAGFEPLASGAPPSAVGSVARSCPALTRTQLELPWVRRALSGLDEGAASVMLRATPELRCRRLVVRMHAADEVVGHLELGELGRPFSPSDVKALEQAALSLTLKVVGMRRRAQADRRAREEFVADLLGGRGLTPVLRGRAAALGVDVEAPHAVVLACWPGRVPETDATRRRRDLAGQLATLLGDGGRCLGSAADVDGAAGDAVLVALDDAAAARSVLASACQAAGERLDARFLVVSDPGPLVGVGAVVARSVRVAGMLGESLDPPAVAFAADFELVSLLVEGAGVRAARRYATELLGPLHRHDEQHHGALAATLRAFVECEAQVRATALRLTVHENTVRYRLGRIRDVTGRDPERLQELLNMATALRVEALYGVAG